MRLALLPFALLLVAPAAQSWECSHREARNLDLAAAGVRTLEVKARAGELSIRSAAGDQIAVRGEACAGDAASLAGIRLVESRRGDVLTVEVQMPESESDRWFDGDAPRTLDLALTVPARLALVVADTSGDIDVRGVASLVLADSSGDIEIDSIAGAVEVTDSSGGIEVRDVGSLRIPADSSGDIAARNVRGPVEIEVDSSGDITLEDIEGDAIVEQDSSGEIAFTRVRGSARVGRDSSGGIVADGIGGDFVVRHDGSGGIRHERVAGRVDVPHGD